jgi:glycine dehydrogenase
VELPEGISSGDIEKTALENRINFLYIDGKTVGISLDETTLPKDLNQILAVFAEVAQKRFTCN